MDGSAGLNGKRLGVTTEKTAQTDRASKAARRSGENTSLRKFVAELEPDVREIYASPRARNAAVSGISGSSFACCEEANAASAA